jgi:hypothetical protein
MTKPIDMVCVTTTMEVGVDIGSLQAIFQGNMPPTRYNYQQRVGRGGRRGQAYSTAVTFCRGRSHDVYYYDKATDEMVGGIPATPKLSLAPYRDTDGSMKMKMAIMKRVIVKEILHLAYLGLDYQIELVDTAGEFGYVYEWGLKNKTQLEEWIEANDKEIDNIVHRYFDQFNINNIIANDISEIIKWIKDSMVKQIDVAVKKSTNTSVGLATYLAETGFLPMYGMPSESRVFYHGYDEASKKIKCIDRSSEMAILEFAPGVEKTKDKGRYRVEGLTTPINDSNDGLSFYDNEADALSDCAILSYAKRIGERDNNIVNITDVPDGAVANDVDLGENQRLVVIPQAYRSLIIRGNAGTPIENNDRSSNFAQTLIFAKDNNPANGKANTRQVGNVQISIYEMGLNDDPTVWRINCNNNRFYTGNYSAKGLDNPRSNNKKNNFLFFDKTDSGVDRKTEGIEIALGSKKTTEMVKLEILSCPEVLDLNLKTGNRSAIRAAYYSAAFILQRALADKLDVQPDEIEICEKIDEQSGSLSLYLSDALPNGAGIVSHLYEDGKLEELIKNIVTFKSFDSTKTSEDKSFMQYLISSSHTENCVTACQKCLLTYSNRGFHHILDWRLGIGLLRLMLDKTYDFGYDESRRANYKELSDWDNLVQACGEKLKLNKIENYNGISGIKKNGKCTIIYHPLWKKKRVAEQVADSAFMLMLYNTFKVLRSELTEDNKQGASIVHQPPTTVTSIQSKPKKQVQTKVDDTTIDGDLEL